MTRALDEACARAMGWTHRTDLWPHFLPLYCWVRPGKEICEELPEFSTDPATDAEKFAWLKGDLRIDRDVGAVAFAERERGGDQSWRLWSAAAYVKPVDEGDDGVRVGHGGTLTLALCNLVIAVAQAEAERKARRGRR